MLLLLKTVVQRLTTARAGGQTEMGWNGAVGSRGYRGDIIQFLLYLTLVHRRLAHRLNLEYLVNVISFVPWEEGHILGGSEELPGGRGEQYRAVNASSSECFVPHMILSGKVCICCDGCGCLSPPLSCHHLVCVLSLGGFTLFLSSVRRFVRASCVSSHLLLHDRHVRVTFPNPRSSDVRMICALPARSLPPTLAQTQQQTQSKIVSAAARYGKSDWIWREEASSEQNFLVCNSVSFKMFEQEVRLIC